MMKLIRRPFFLLLVWMTAICSNSLEAQTYPKVFVLKPESLAANKRLIKAGDANLMPAFKQLLVEAENALKYQPVSVMEKKNNPPSGDKHDYMSIAPYFWPDSTKTEGVPYMNRDGLINPEVREYKDKIYLVEICDNVSTLALAWYFTDNIRYANQAEKLLRTWFLDAETKMNPNLNYAQAVKGRAEGRGYGLIDTRHFVKLVEAIGLIGNAPTWTAQDQQGIKNWFAEFLNWMQTSKNGLEEMHTLNNHRVWYDLQRISYALFTENLPLAKEVVENAKEQLEKQMDTGGSFPLEMKRTISLHYTVFVLDPFFTIAGLAKNVGVDFWNFVTPSGKSLKKGFDNLLPYLSHEKEWTGPQIKPFDYKDAIPLLIMAAENYHCVNCTMLANKIAGDKAKTLREHLTAGVVF